MFASHGAIPVMNGDQGSVFSSEEYVSLLEDKRVTLDINR